MSRGALLLAGATCLAIAIVMGRAASRIWLSSMLVGVTMIFTAALHTLIDGRSWRWSSAITIGGEQLHLRMDAISALFMALLAVVGGAGAVYAREYWGEGAHPRSAGQGRMWW